MHSQIYSVMKYFEVRVDITVKCADKIGKLRYSKIKQIFMG